jgi:hypothetical protein
VSILYDFVAFCCFLAPSKDNQEWHLSHAPHVSILIATLLQHLTALTELYLRKSRVFRYENQADLVSDLALELLSEILAKAFMEFIDILISV